MKRKLRIFSNIAVICLSVCMFAFGVYAASTVSVTTSGTVSFTATGVYAKITGSISGTTETGLTYAELTTNADGTITGDTSSWTSKNVTFDSDNEIVLTITVQNLATEEGRNVYATLYDIDQPASLNTTMLLGSKDYLSSTVTEIAPAASKTFQVKLSPKDLNSSFTADYEYLLDLDAEKFNTERIESKIKTGVNNSEYGSITYSLDDATKTQLTLTATPNDGFKFLGFTSGSSNSGKFVFVGIREYAGTISTYTLNLNLFDNRSYYAIFYSSEVESPYESTKNTVKFYVGSNYCVFIGTNDSISSTTTLPTEIIYNDDEYCVAILSSNSNTIFDDEITEYMIPNNITALINASSYLSENNISKVIISENVGYVDHFCSIIWDNNSSVFYLNNKQIINCLSEDTIYASAAGFYISIYINNNIEQYLQYNEWFTENYEKSSDKVTHTTGTYYLYTPKS